MRKLIVYINSCLECPSCNDILRFGDSIKNHQMTYYCTRIDKDVTEAVNAKDVDSDCILPFGFFQ